MLLLDMHVCYVPLNNFDLQVCEYSAVEYNTTKQIFKGFWLHALFTRTYVDTTLKLFRSFV
jgi:hypothetical protein